MTISLGPLANLARLRAFINVMSGMTGASASMALKSVVEVLERQLCLRPDDIDEARRLGRLVQVVRVPSDPRPHGRGRR